MDNLNDKSTSISNVNNCYKSKNSNLNFNGFKVEYLNGKKYSALTSIQITGLPSKVYAIDDINVSACGTLNTANTYYQLNQSISTTSTTSDCIVITGENITFDLNGWNMTNDVYPPSSADLYYGIYSTGKNNVTIKNGLIHGFSNAIWITNSNYLTVYNMTGQQNANSVILAGYFYLTGNNINVSRINIIDLFTTGLGTAIRTEGSNNSYSDINITDLTSRFDEIYGFFILDSLSQFKNIKVVNLEGATGANAMFIYGQNNSFDNIAAYSNTITDEGDVFGFYLSSSSYNNLSNIISINNWIDRSSQIIGGIYLTSSNNNNFVNVTSSENSDSGCENNEYYPIGIISSSRNTFTNILSENNIPCSNEPTLYIATSSNNTFINGNLDYGVHNLASNTNLINMTYTTETSGTTSTLSRYWWYNANVSSSGTGLNGAVVDIYNKNGVLQASPTTGSGGLTSLVALLEYNRTGTAKTYWSNYSMNASAVGYTNLSKSHNLTTNIYNDVFSFMISLNCWFQYTTPIKYIFIPVGCVYSRQVGGFDLI
jgi:hypothetical protein